MTQSLTPHGDGFRFIDTFERLDASHAIAWKFLSPEEPYFSAHFPGNPIMPAVLIVECAAQAAGTLWMSQQNFDPAEPLFLASIEKFRILAPAYPKETIRTEVELTKELGSIARFEIKCSVGERAIAQGQLILSRQLTTTKASEFK